MTITSEYEAIATAHSANLSSAAIWPIQTKIAAGRVHLCDRSNKCAAAMWGNGWHVAEIAVMFDVSERAVHDGIDLYMWYGKELVK